MGAARRTDVLRNSLLAAAWLASLGGCAHLKEEAPNQPNWSVRENWLDDDRVALDLSMKRIHLGGDGEAGQVFRDRVRSLMHEHGFTRYTILRYEERIESNWIAQRQAYGEVAFQR